MPPASCPFMESQVVHHLCRKVRPDFAPPYWTPLDMCTPRPPPLTIGGWLHPPPYWIWWVTAGLPMWPPWRTWMGCHSSDQIWLAWWFPTSIYGGVVMSAYQIRMPPGYPCTTTIKRLHTPYLFLGRPCIVHNPSSVSASKAEYIQGRLSLE